MVVLVRLWILLSALLVASGWILSALHQLNRAGYLTVFALALLAAAWQWRKSPPLVGGVSRRTGHKLWRRFHCALPGLFLLLAIMSLTAGVLYCPFNGDSDVYRIPRVFHWLGREQWHWIHTDDSRLNIAATGFEWLCAPIILFTRYDWGIFVINWISFLLLPGLIFSMFLRLGVRPLVAWWWMWLLPTGWCFVWQAQSTNNDCFATVYALASVDFALRARQNGHLGDWWLAILAAALLSGAKQTNLPLLLVSAIALWPGLRPICTRPVTTLFVLAVSLLVSAIPTGVLNYQHTGSWMGTMATDPAWIGCVLPSPFWGFVGNIFCLTAQNLKPPLFPVADAWNAAMQHFVETPFGSHFKSFESFGYQDHAANGESLGLFLCVLTLISIVWAYQHRAIAPCNPKARRDGLVRMLRLAPWVALLVFMAKVGTAQNARQLAPYYFFFFPLLLAGTGHAGLVRQRWWRLAALLVSLGTAVMLFVSRTNPLFPAQSIFGWLHHKYPKSQTLAQALGSFSSHNPAAIRRRAFKSELPAEEKVLGYYAGIRCLAEPGQWQPFGIRRVERISTGDSLAYVRSLGLHYLVVDSEELKSTKQGLEDWLREYDAELVTQIALVVQYNEPAQTLYLVRLRPDPARVP